MSWRWMHALTLVFLMLALAPPRSAGDKGAWSGPTAAPVQHLQAEVGTSPVELGIVLPDVAGRITRTLLAPRPDRTDTAPRPVATSGFLPSSVWTTIDLAPLDPYGEPFADHSAPRAPPA